MRWCLWASPFFYVLEITNIRSIIQTQGTKKAQQHKIEGISPEPTVRLNIEITGGLSNEEVLFRTRAG